MTTNNNSEKVRVIKSQSFVHYAFFDDVKPHQGGLNASPAAQAMKESNLANFRRMSRDY